MTRKAIAALKAALGQLEGLKTKGGVHASSVQSDIQIIRDTIKELSAPAEFAFTKPDPRGSEYGKFIVATKGDQYIVTHSSGYSMTFDDMESFNDWSGSNM